MKSYVWEKDVVPRKEMIGFKIKQRLNYRNYIKTRLYSPSKGTWKNESVNSDSRGCQPVLKLHSYFQRNPFCFKISSSFCYGSQLCEICSPFLHPSRKRTKEWHILPINWSFFGGYGPHLVVKSLFFFFQRTISNSFRVFRMEGRWVSVMLRSEWRRPEGNTVRLDWTPWLPLGQRS